MEDINHYIMMPKCGEMKKVDFMFNSRYIKTELIEDPWTPSQTSRSIGR